MAIATDYITDDLSCSLIGGALCRGAAPLSLTHAKNLWLGQALLLLGIRELERLTGTGRRSRLRELVQKKTLYNSRRIANVHRQPV